MSSVASISPVSGSGGSTAAHAVENVENYVSFIQSLKATQSTSTAKSVSNSARSTAASPTSVPLGILLAVPQPSASNTLATSDYHQLHLDLVTDNLAAAQQAYLRLQNDLVFDPANRQLSQLNTVA